MYDLYSVRAVVFQYNETVLMHESAVSVRGRDSLWFAIIDIKDRLVPFLYKWRGSVS